MIQNIKGYKVQIINLDTNIIEEFQMSYMRLKMHADLEEVSRSGSFDIGMVPRGYSLDLTGYIPNPDFERDWQETFESLK